MTKQIVEIDWISATDKMPAEKEWVMIADKDGAVWFGAWCAPAGCWADTSMPIGGRDDYPFWAPIFRGPSSREEENAD